jgi:phospholipase C
MAPLPNGSRAVRHVVILMMENRSFDHFLDWLPGAEGRHDLTFVSAVESSMASFSGRRPRRKTRA